MKTSDLESKIEEPYREEIQHQFSDQLYTEDKLSRYTANVNAAYSHIGASESSFISADASISLIREDLSKDIKKKHKLQLQPKFKIVTTEESHEKYRIAWKINIRETCFSWAIVDWDRSNDSGSYGMNYNYREIFDSIRTEARRKNINIKDALMNLLGNPLHQVEKEFKKYMRTIRKPILEKGVVNKTIIYDDEPEKIRELRPYWR